MGVGRRLMFLQTFENRNHIQAQMPFSCSAYRLGMAHLSLASPPSLRMFLLSFESSFSPNGRFHLSLAVDKRGKQEAPIYSTRVLHSHLKSYPLSSNPRLVTRPLPCTPQSNPGDECNAVGRALKGRSHRHDIRLRVLICR